MVLLSSDEVIIMQSALNLSKEIINLSKRTRIITFETVRDNNFDPVEDMIGSITLNHPIDVESLLKEGSFYGVSKDFEI
ncbi:MAG: hypothetical protein AB1422_06430 [bacterium]